MRIKDLFTVPEGKKITEKMFGRVLLSSICSILLCMGCLAGTTWAWFTASIENPDNVIQIASATQTVTVKQAGLVISKSNDGSYQLAPGTYSVHVQLENDATDADDLDKEKGKVYVVMVVTQESGTNCYYFTFEGNADTDKTIENFTVEGESATVTFSVSWVKPASATPVGGDSNVIEEEPTDPVTDPTEESTEPVTDPTEEPTEPVTDPTEESTEPVTDPTEESTEPVIDPTEESTEPVIDPTEESTEPVIDPTEESTDPVTDPTDATVDPEAAV